MLGCHFELMKEETIQKHIKHRHQLGLLQLEKLQAKLSTVVKKIKEHNPSLISHICREVQALRPYGDPIDARKVKASSKSNDARSQRSNRSGRSGKASRRSVAGSSVAGGR